MNNKLPEAPQHVAIIMDGNRRWAKARGLPALAGHQKVADDILEPLIEHAADVGVKYITFWAWSTENWQRNKDEVVGIMRIFRHLIKRQWDRLHKKGVRIKTIGDISKFPPDICESLTKVVDQTKDNTRVTAIFALNYGGRDELVRAVNKAFSCQLSAVSQKKGRNQVEGWRLTAESFSQYLDSADIPDPEMIVRTGGEQRLSGFLLWQSEYSELFFPEWYMPDFVPQKLDELILEYHRRNRRFGK